MFDLNDLASRVEQGETSSEFIGEIHVALHDKNMDGGLALQVILLSNSLDAAMALHKRLLPNWECDICMGSRGHATVYREDHEGFFHKVGDADYPAVAWLSAILRAVDSTN